MLHDRTRCCSRLLGHFKRCLGSVWLQVLIDPLVRSSLYLLFIGVIVSITNCDNSSDFSDSEESVFDLVVNPSQTKTFLYDEESNPVFSFLKNFVDAGEPLVLMPDKRNHTIEFYDAEGGLPIRSIKLDFQGPDGVSQISNFHYHNDSLFVIDAFKYKIVMFDMEGKAIQRYNLFNQELPFTVLPRYFMTSQMAKEGNSLFFIGDPDLNINEKSTYAQARTLVELDLLSGELTYHAPVPNILVDDYWVINQHFFDATKFSSDSWVYSFDLSDSLFIHNTRGGIETKLARSKYHKSLKRWGKKDLNSEKAYRYYLSQTSYWKVIYNPFQEVFYRFVKHPNENAILEGNLDRMWARDFSIMVLDKGFNVLAERKFEIGEMIGSITILDESGLWLSYTDSTITTDGVKKYVHLKLQEKNG